MSWEAKPPPPTPPQLTVRPQRASPASSCFRRQGCHPAKRSNGDFQLSKCILRHQFLINSSNIFYHCKQCSCWCFQKLLISIMVCPAQSPETVPANMPSCWLIFAWMWLFVEYYVSVDSWVGFAEKIIKKDYYLTRRWSIEIGPDLSLPPCTTACTVWPMLQWKPLRSKARGLVQHGGPPGWLEESHPAGVI